MRPGQNNKRMRGRNNNRKGPNPLTRSYESNGPDVKIRGTAHHVAEKYLQLARDAQSSGDPVMAESYLQHAEHYFRLIAAAQLAQQQAQVGYMRQPGEVEVDEDDDDDLGGLPDRFASPAERFVPPQPQFNQPQPQVQPPMAQPQPYADRPPYGQDRNAQGQNQAQPQGQERTYQDRGDRQQRQDRPYQDRNDRQPRQDRQQQDRPQQDRPQQDRNDQNRFNQNRGQRDNRPQRDFRMEQPREQPQPVVDAEPAALPSFITSPVRIPVAEVAQPSTPVADQPQTEANDAGEFHLRPRRRRRPRTEPGAEGPEADAPAGMKDDVPVGE